MPRRHKGPKRQAKSTDERHKQNNTKPRTHPKRKRDRAARVCPVHGVELRHLHGRFGVYWKCPEPDCDVRCSGGATSTPCDQATANERARTHQLFDPLWRRGSPQKRFARRDGAYVWLARVIGLSEAETHIGAFSLEQCLRAQAAVHELLKGK